MFILERKLQALLGRSSTLPGVAVTQSLFCHVICFSFYVDLVHPLQSPGGYYFKPMMKEFRFEPASQMITVEEGQILSIDITGIKTAYRYCQFSSS